MKHIFLFIFTVLLFSNAYSQNWQKIDSVFSPIGISVKGFSCPFFSDLNNDGKPDLLLGNSESNAEFYYNRSAPLNPHFSLDTNILAPVYINGQIGANSDYPLTADLNGDGLSDLIIGGYNGILYYKNIGTKTNPVFQKDESALFTNINLEIGVDAKPAFADLDGDGDLDLIVGIGESLFGGPAAGQTFGYRNTGNKNSPAFIMDSSLVAGIQNMGYNSYPAIADLDGDGKLDILFGRDKATFVYYKNTGTVNMPVWTLNTTVFASVEQSSYWKNPALCDIDGDGDIDLVYGTSSGQMYYYQNTGTKTSPQFVQNSTFFSVIKVAGASSASFFDYDKNGTIDFISGSQLGGFQFFNNEGSRSHPVFSSKTMPFSSFKPGIYSSPVFVDINNDGQIDIVSGALSGKLYCYINKNNVFTENTTLLSSIDVKGFSQPAFGDINNDGKIDLLVGAENTADVKFYLNDGNGFVQNNLIFETVYFPSRCFPVLVDIDGDGDLDLVIGKSGGSIVYYENTGTKSNPVWSLNENIFAGIKVKQNAAPGFADLDGDGRKDMIIGEYNGNLTYYKNLFAKPTSVKNETLPYSPADFSLEQNYPNPFNPQTIIRYQVPVSSFVSIKLYDLLGNEIKTLLNETKNAGSYQVTLDASGLASGIYFYSFKAGSFTSTKKLQLLK